MNVKTTGVTSKISQKAVWVGYNLGKDVFSAKQAKRNQEYCPADKLIPDAGLHHLRIAYVSAIKIMKKI